MDDLLGKLEDYKLRGWKPLYAVTIHFGEEIGCDDSDVPAMDRSIRITGSPVGCLGGARVAFIGHVRDFLTFDFKQRPEIVKNPPSSKLFATHSLKKGVSRWIVWGSGEAMQMLFQQEQRRAERQGGFDRPSAFDRFDQGGEG